MTDIVVCCFHCAQFLSFISLIRIAKESNKRSRRERQSLPSPHFIFLCSFLTSGNCHPLPLPNIKYYTTFLFTASSLLPGQLYSLFLLSELSF